MTGYENLEHELSKEFNASKVKSNQAFIQAIVRILTENAEDKIALEMAERTRKEAENILLIAQQKEMEADDRSRATQHKLLAITSKEEELKEIESHIEEIRTYIEGCETSEARDKIRLAEYFCRHCGRDVAFTRGLSNILGNGNGGNRTVNEDSVIPKDESVLSKRI